MAVGKSARETVVAFINALNSEDFRQARQYADGDLTSVGVLGSRPGADAYFAHMEKMRLKYDVKKAFADGGDVCVWSEIQLSGAAVLTAGWYQVRDGKVHSLKVVFDPRPVLAPKAPQRFATKKRIPFPPYSCASVDQSGKGKLEELVS